jgi:hypothetical protein
MSNNDESLNKHDTHFVAEDYHRIRKGMVERTGKPLDGARGEALTIKALWDVYSQKTLASIIYK